MRAIVEGKNKGNKLYYSIEFNRFYLFIYFLKRLHFKIFIINIK